MILAANAGHSMTVAVLLEHNADIEAQTDRTKDTSLSLACSSGRQEVQCLLHTLCYWFGDCILLSTYSAFPTYVGVECF